MNAKRASGPYPLSCITCRERRKKCDRTHPTCNRCRAGGFTCLGYESRSHQLGCSPQTTILFNQSMEQLSVQSAAPPINTLNSNLAFVSFSEDTQLLETRSDSLASHDQLPEGSVWEPVLTDPLTTQMVPRAQLSRYWSSPSGLIGQPPPTANTPYPLGGAGAGRPLSHGQMSSVRGNSESDLDAAQPSQPTWSKNQLYEPITRHFGKKKSLPTIYSDLDSSVTVVEFITSQYERGCHMMLFGMVTHQSNYVRKGILAGISASKCSCWSLCLGAQIHDVLIETNSRASVRPFVKQLDRFGQQIKGALSKTASIRELDGWLAAGLEMFYMRLLVDAPLAYRLLCDTAPIVVHIANADPTLWSKESNAQLISLHGALSSSNPRISRFATTDIAMSLLFGVPHLVQWDLSFHPGPSSPIVEWMPGCPPQFAIALARINAWRTQSAFMGEVNQWKEIEKVVQGWVPCPSIDSSFGSLGAIGRLSVQEALRHGVLIYLYMGMCGLSSSDSRVQESCRQIVQLSSVTNAVPTLSLHFFIPMVMAGICASNEQYRGIIYRNLSQVKACRIFLFHQTDFTGVLDHLWHGVAKAGADVLWGDYLASCHAVIRMES